MANDGGGQVFVAPDTDRITGKASYFSLNGTRIPITAIRPKVMRKYVDDTDSGDYISADEVIAPKQKCEAVVVEAHVEGRYRKSSTPSSVIATLFKNPPPVSVVIGLDIVGPVVLGHGLYDITEFETDIPYDDVITYTMDIKSYGRFTPNS